MPPDGSPFSCPCGDPLLESLRPLLEPSLCLARDGQLPHANAATLASGELAMRLLPGEFRDVHHAATLSRALFQRAVSWALFSEQWLDALASLLKACGRTRVLELAAGAGVLAAPMRRRGLVWRTTDQKPAPDPTPTPIPNPSPYPNPSPSPSPNPNPDPDPDQVALLHRDEEPGLQEQASLALANIASRESTKLLILRLNVRRPIPRSSPAPSPRPPPPHHHPPTHPAPPHPPPTHPPRDARVQVLDILFRLSRSASRQVAEASRRVLDVLGCSLSPASRRAVVGAVGAPSTSCRNKQFHRRGSPLAAGGAGASRSSLSPLGAMADEAGVELD